MVNIKQVMSLVLMTLIMASIFLPGPVTQAAAADNILSALTAPTAGTAVPDGTGGSSGGILGKLFDVLFNKILGPLFNIFGGNASSPSQNPVKINPLPAPGDGGYNAGTLQGKVIVIDPGHGGNNPGAVANNTRESDNNLAVGIKLRNKLTAAGAKVIMTRDSDRTVAPAGSTQGQELQARVDIAEKNQADIFVSLHSNENPNKAIAGAMTFYPTGKSADLALTVQNELVRVTNAIDKGVSPASFYVLRNNSVPSILVEMGFVSNRDEAAKLNSDQYRTELAQGICSGIIKYLNR